VKTHRWARSLLVLALMTTPVVALQPSSPPPITLQDIPGTDREWQEASAVIDAPPAQVRHWLTAYEEWRSIYPDMEWVQRIGTDEQGRDVVRFRSRYAGRTITMHQQVTSKMMVYEGWGPNVHSQGRTYVIDLGGDKTRVIMQTSAEVHGLAGVFATKGLKRSRAFQALRGHLTALLDAAAAR
jgi:hypothetical protein